jgi:iron complex outermembrane receptor protein
MKKHHKASWPSSLAIAAPILMATPAMAQTAPAPDQPASTSLTQAEPAAEPRDSNDIVVTATRREERAQNIPAAISVIGGSTLTQTGITQTSDLSQVVPGLNFAQGSVAPQPTIRGIGSRGATPGDESAVPIYLDGVYQPYSPGLVFQLAGIDRIEVLKGPQGTLYGRNATGGAINIVTKAPTDGFSGSVLLGYGSYEQKTADFNVNLGSPTIAFNLSGHVEKDDGYMRDLNLGIRTARKDGFVLHPRLRIAPSSRLTIDIGGFFSNFFNTTAAANFPDHGNTSARLNQPNLVYPTEPFTTTQNFPPKFKALQTLVSGAIKYDLDFAQLVSIAAYQHNKSAVALDTDATPLVQGESVNNASGRTWSEELYLTSSGNGPFAWTIGGSYIFDKSGYDYQISNYTTARTSLQTTEAIAGYFEGTYKITDQLSLTLGGRYTSESKDFRAQALVPATLAPTGPVSTGHALFSKFTPSGTLTYRFTPKTQAYIRIGQAFKSGLYNTGSLDTRVVRPETVTQYEFGVKSDPLPWLRTNVAIYYSKYDDQQVSARDPVTNAPLTQNAAKSNLYGYELELIFHPATGLNLNVGVAGTRARFDEFPAASINVPRPASACGSPTITMCGNTTAAKDLSGYVLPKVPGYTINVGLIYHKEAGPGVIDFAANFYRQGRSYWYPDNRLSQAPYNLVNGSVGYTLKDGLSFTLWANNLFNQRYVATETSSTNGDFIYFARPRTLGGRVGFKW